MKDLISALQIFLKYGNPDYPTDCRDETLSVMINPNIVTYEDKNILEELGFLIDDENECFISFKYGSI